MSDGGGYGLPSSLRGCFGGSRPRARFDYSREGLFRLVTVTLVEPRAQRQSPLEIPMVQGYWGTRDEETDVVLDEDAKRC
jgi:hypothetical protein